MNLVDLNQKCRLCFEKKDDIIDTIFHDYLKMEIYFLFDFMIKPEDSLSTKVCSLCSGKVMEYSAFKKRVMGNQKLIQTIIKPEIVDKIVLSDEENQDLITNFTESNETAESNILNNGTSILNIEKPLAIVIENPRTVTSDEFLLNQRNIDQLIVNDIQHIPDETHLQIDQNAKKRSRQNTEYEIDEIQEINISAMRKKIRSSINNCEIQPVRLQKKSKHHKQKVSEITSPTGKIIIKGNPHLLYSKRLYIKAIPLKQADILKLESNSIDTAANPEKKSSSIDNLNNDVVFVCSSKNNVTKTCLANIFSEILKNQDKEIYSFESKLDKINFERATSLHETNMLLAIRKGFEYRKTNNLCPNKSYTVSTKTEASGTVVSNKNIVGSNENPKSNNLHIENLPDVAIKTEPLDSQIPFVVVPADASFVGSPNQRPNSTYNFSNAPQMGNSFRIITSTPHEPSVSTPVFIPPHPPLQPIFSVSNNNIVSQEPKGIKILSPNDINLKIKSTSISCDRRILGISLLNFQRVLTIKLNEIDNTTEKIDVNTLSDKEIEDIKKCLLQNEDNWNRFVTAAKTNIIDNDSMIMLNKVFKSNFPPELVKAINFPK